MKSWSTISPRTGGQSISKVASIPLFKAPGLVQHEMGIIYVGHYPLLVYPLSTWCNCMWPHLPGLLPLYSHTTQTNTGGGNSGIITQAVKFETQQTRHVSTHCSLNPFVQRRREMAHPVTTKDFLYPIPDMAVLISPCMWYSTLI